MLHSSALSGLSTSFEAFRQRWKIAAGSSEICRILKRETNHGHNGHISLHIPTLFFNSHLPCFIDMRMGQNLGFMPESWGVRGKSIHGSTDTIYFHPDLFHHTMLIICTYIYIYIIYIHMVVSWNGATPIAGWFIVELPSIHGWELGWPILGNPHMTHMFVIYL